MACQQSNSTPESPERPELNHAHTCSDTEDGVFLAIIGVTGFAVFFGNIFTCGVFLSKRQLRENHMNTFLISLAVSDILVSVLVIPGHTTLCTGCSSAYGNLASQAICSVLDGVKDYVLLGSIFNLMAVTFDRYQAVLRPLRYKDLITSMSVTLILLTVWLLPLPLSFVKQVTYSVNPRALSGNAHHLFDVVLVSVFILIPMCVVLIVNILLTNAIRVQAVRIRSHDNRDWSNSQLQSVKQTEPRPSVKCELRIQEISSSIERETEATVYPMTPPVANACGKLLTCTICSSAEKNSDSGIEIKEGGGDNENIHPVPITEKSDSSRVLVSTQTNEASDIARLDANGGGMHVANERNSEVPYEERANTDSTHVNQTKESNFYKTKSRDYKGPRKFEVKKMSLNEYTSALSQGGKRGTARRRKDSKARRERNGTVSCLIVALVFILCWTPRVLYNFLKLFNDEIGHNSLVGKLSMLLLFVQSVVNPLVYSTYRSDFRHAAKDLLRSALRLLRHG
ncbi:predicted protein [Nematostella vectensis]|uniref:G-protein coupled receptors family 1 profile domain-containing protein n=1 Tax=Nematostella vectensis TaxID=45351 RepID=A7SJS8_NEMVE|nr:predicted protein [Nematostella vectensis]|eukprot:XP_001628116.1 predicted protein [Nematostella vectensis]